MISALKYLSDLSNSALPAVADHLWQSTLFAIAAGLVILTLRGHSARFRYIVWLAAALKFLLPFSLLIAIGSLLRAGNNPTPTNSGIYFIEELTQPFMQAPPAIGSVVAAVSTNTGTMAQWKTILLAGWLSGTLALLFIWVARWWQAFVARGNATLLTNGREVSVLRRLETTMRITRKLKLLRSPTSHEPGVFGIFRPVLLWPSSISEHLDDSHLEAVLAHELFHVQRRDNLTAGVQMLVQGIFWFHPVVWWLGASLIEERERACDEAVIELGSGRQIYAESILTVCKFCLSSPVTCVSGVTGANLKKRMVHIMTDRILPKLNFTRKLLLWTSACLALAIPFVYGLLNPTPGRAASDVATGPRYVTVSIKPHSDDIDKKTQVSKMNLGGGIGAGFTVRGITPPQLIQLAYHIQNSQLANSPGWFNSVRYDIDAQVDKAENEQLRRLTEDQRGAINDQLLQGLLADHFKLKVHQEARELTVYELAVAEGGSKLQKGDKQGPMYMGIGQLSSTGSPLSLLAAQLSTSLGRTVVDKTGLSGNYSFSLRWTPDADEQQAHVEAGHEPTLPSEASSSPSPLIVAIQEQLGLTLQPQTDRVQVLVIDHIEQPAQD